MKKNAINPNLHAAGIPLLLHISRSSKVDTKQKIEYLLQKGANPNAQAVGKKKYDNTAAHLMLANEAYDLMRYIIDTAKPYKPQDLNIQDSEGKTLLLMAIKLRHTPTIKYLIDSGADIHIPDNMGRTPLHMAAIIGNAEVFELLIRKGADIDCKDNWGRTPLGYLQMTRQLRLECIQSTLKEIFVDPIRDEKAIHNCIIDSQFDEVQIATSGLKGTEILPFPSIQKYKDILLPILQNQNNKEPKKVFGMTSITNGENFIVTGYKYHSGDEGFIIDQINAFTGRSIEKACLMEQEQLLFSHKEEMLDNQAVKLLNQKTWKALKNKGVNGVCFKAQANWSMPQIIDAVMELPKGEKILVKIKEVIESIVGNSMIIHLYEKQGKNYLMISHINAPEKMKMILKNVDTSQNLSK